MMTAHPETRYTCDRCGMHDNVAATINPPPHERQAGPRGWLMLRIGSDPSVPPSHLCDKCNAAFKTFMDEP